MSQIIMINGDDTSLLKESMLIRVHYLLLFTAKTYEYVSPGQGSTNNTWISQPGPGLAKRQCSLQVIFRPEGSQPRLAIFFCGQEKRISDDEKMTWRPDVDVFPIKCVVRSIRMHQMV